MRRIMLTVFALLVALLGAASPALAQKRVALVVGQDKYTNLSELANPRLDARRMAALLTKHGFEVMSCDGRAPGCFDLNRTGLLQALDKLQAGAAGSDLAAVFFAGHGLASEEGNILTPVDADVDCKTGAVTNGVTVERIMAATQPARHKLVILDACRDNPIGAVCPELAGKKLSFTRIEAGAMQGLLLVTSTQFGQQALDGLAGSHSPFATALFAALEANPAIYFEQVMNEVARATYETAHKNAGFLQIPGKVVGGAAPADCLAGRGCIGDARMAALAVENERLAADASGVRNLLAAEEKARGKAYTAEERQKRVAELERTIASIGGSSDPLRQEARRLIDAGNVTGGQAKLDEALDADEKAIAEAERVAAEKRKAAAQSARDLAVLARGTDVMKAVAYFQRATRLDPADPQTWIDYGETAHDAGRTSEAKGAFGEALIQARRGENPLLASEATYRLGDVAMDQGNLQHARQLYEAALAIIQPLAKTDPSNTGWQRALLVSHNRIGDVLVEEGTLSTALESYRASLAIVERLVKADPGNTDRQFDLSKVHRRVAHVLQGQGDLSSSLESYRSALEVADELTARDANNANWQWQKAALHGDMGDVSLRRGNLADALGSFRAVYAGMERLAKADPGNAVWQRDLAVAQEKIGHVHRDQGNLPAASQNYRDSLAIKERLAKADPGNAFWQRDLAVSHGLVATVLARQGSRSEAVKAFEQGRAIILRLRQQSPDNARLPKDLAWLDAELAALK